MTTVPRIAVVGGGVSVLALLDALAAAALGPIDLRLHARRADRTEVIAAAARDALARHALARADRSPELTVSAVADLDEAVSGTDFVILLVRVGGAAARHHDETFPTHYGLMGDEGLGLGGAANAWRTLPVLDDIAAAVRRGARRAVVLNQVAPLGITTRRLLDLGLQADGICELPTVTRERLDAAAPGGPLRGVGYAGLNHAGWFVPSRRDDAVAGHDLHTAGLAASLVDAATWARYGGVPTPYHYRVLEPGAGASLGIRQPPGRARQLAELSDEIFDAIRRGEPAETHRRPTPWFDRALVPVLAAHLGAQPYRGTMNVPNGDLLSEVPPEVIVEVDATVDHSSTSIGHVPPRPAAASELVAALGRAEHLLYGAVVNRERPGLRRAIAELPAELRPASDRLDDALDEVMARVEVPA